MANTLIFLAEKNVSSSTHIFAAKISIYLKKILVVNVNEFFINKLVKVTML